MVSRLTLYCDRCDEAGRVSEGVPRRLGLESTWYEIHSCERCDKELADLPFAEAVTFFREHGESFSGHTGESVDDGKTLPCLWCPKVYISAGGLDGHLRTFHGFDSPEEAWGTRCPACGSSDFSRMSTHAARTHHRHISVLMGEAFNNGDPYGVAKERRRALIPSVRGPRSSVASSRGR